METELGAHVSFTIRSHGHPSLFYFLYLQFHSGSIHLQQLINSKQKSKPNFRVRVTYTATQHPVTRTYHLSKLCCSIQQRLYTHIREVYMNSGRTGTRLQSHFGPERRLCCATSLSLSHFSFCSARARP